MQEIQKPEPLAQRIRSAALDWLPLLILLPYIINFLIFRDFDMMICGLSVPIYAAFYNSVYFRYFSKMKAIPSPKTSPSPLTGHFNAVFTIMHGIRTLKYSKERPEASILRVANGDGQSIIALSPKAITEVLVAHDDLFVKINPLSFFIGRLARGILYAKDHEQHAQMRGALLPAFTTENVHALVPGFLSEAGRLASVVRHEAVTEPSAKKLNTSRILMRSATDTMFLSLIGKHFNALENASSFLNSTWERVYSQDNGLSATFYEIFSFIKWKNLDTIDQYVSEAFLQKLSRNDFAESAAEKQTSSDIASFLINHDAQAWTSKEFVNQVHSREFDSSLTISKKVANRII